MKILLTGVAALFCLFLAQLPLSAYVVDANIFNDWGVDLSAAVQRGYLNTHITAGDRVDVAVDDDADMTMCPQYKHGAWYVNPGYSVGNMCDAEAIYFDNDAKNAYLAIIQGLPIGGASAPGWSPSTVYPGDIAFSIGGKCYNYGLDIDPVTGGACMKAVKPWQWQCGMYSPGVPYRILCGKNLGAVSFAYSTAAVNGHYVMEASFPLELLGLSIGDRFGILWNMSCGNDYLSLLADIDPVPVPEPSTFILLMTGFVGSCLPFIRRRYNEMRRFTDIVISVLALFVSFPLLVLAAIAIKLESSGPIFYGQERVGVNRRKRTNRDRITGNERRGDDVLGKPFTIYKLRTMRNDAEAKSGPVWAQKNDCRVTRVGRFLRKTRIDEIPQFINVLQGNMSIIGPRPERPVFVKHLNGEIRYYYRRFQMKPGITGLAQVRYAYASSVEDTRKKLKYDLLYVKKSCFDMDMRILVNTMRTVLFAKGAR